VYSVGEVFSTRFSGDIAMWGTPQRRRQAEGEAPGSFSWPFGLQIPIDMMISIAASKKKKKDNSNTSIIPF
jgi:hypothetical protein